MGVSDDTMTITASEANGDHRITTMPNSPFDAETRARNIVEKLGGVWRARDGECRCPTHADRSPSLSVRLGDTAILFHCYAGCQTVDVMRALKELRLHDCQPLAMPAAKPVRDLGALAMRLWRASKPIGGTPAEDYLLARGLSGPFYASWHQCIHWLTWHRCTGLW
jgi:putative DNA primase/helicase